jgi:hypothetical protein
LPRRLRSDFHEHWRGSHELPSTEVTYPVEHLQSLIVWSYEEFGGHWIPASDGEPTDVSHLNPKYGHDTFVK